MMIDQSAQKWGANRHTMASVIQCESQWDVEAKGDYTIDGVHFYPKKLAPAGAWPTSFGLVQIHLPAHPDITKQQAYDPVFAIDYLAHQLSIGKGSQWTCY